MTSWLVEELSKWIKVTQDTGPAIGGVRSDQTMLLDHSRPFSNTHSRMMID